MTAARTNAPQSAKSSSRELQAELERLRQSEEERS